MAVALLQSQTYPDYPDRGPGILFNFQEWSQGPKMDKNEITTTDTEIIPKHYLKDSYDTIAIQPFLDLEEPDEKLLKWAENNINEDPDRKVELIEELRDMIFERGEIEPHRTDDAFLLKFLRARNFRVRMAHRLMANYYNFKKSTPEFFENINFEKLIEIGNSKVISTPPYMDQDGRRLMFFNIGNWDTSKHTTADIFQAVILIIEIALLEPKFQIKGGVCVFDFGTLGVGHAWQMTPTIAKQMIQVAYSAIPIRTEAIHIINHSWIFDIGFNILRPFLADYMRERIHFHDSLESLQQHVHPEYLPERYGGRHKDYNFNIWLESLKDNETIIEELTSIGYEGCREFIEKFRLNEED